MTGRALVTGASGFVGRHLAARLLREGWQVTLTTRATSRVPAALAAAAVLRVDDGGEALERGLAMAAPDVCFHLATRFVATHTADDVADLVAANVTFGTQVVQALSGADVAFVNVGTVWQHHDGRAYGPTSLYAATKQAFADVLQYYAECTPLRAVTVELVDTYGPDDTRGKLLSHLVRAHRTGQVLPLSPGDQLVDLLHVDDVVDALLRAVPLASAQAPTFALTGEVSTVRSFVELVGEVLGSPVPVEWGARPHRPREMTTSWRHAPLLPGWSPRTRLRDGLEALLAAGQPPVE